MKTTLVRFGCAVLIMLISACGGGGDGSGQSEYGRSPSIVAPATPNDLTVTGSRTQARLAWSVSDGADYYNIYMDGDFAGSSTACSFTKSGLVTGSTHEFQVSAVNGGGESARCTEVEATATAWTKLLGTTGIDFAKAIAVDGSGNIYIAGYTKGSLDGNANAAIMMRSSPSTTHRA